MSYQNPYSNISSDGPPERGEIYNSVDSSLKWLLDIVYPDTPSGAGIKAYMKDPSPHPVVKYLADYSFLMGEDLAARIIANQMGISIADRVPDDDIYFVDTVEYFLKTEAEKSTVKVTLKYVMGMNGYDYREWIKGQTDTYEYYDRCYYVMKRYYGLDV